MKISHKWLRNYLKTNLEPKIISEILTDIGLEVESMDVIEPIKGGLKGVIVGRVLTCEKHPDADKLSITTVDVGADEPLQIVCGAPNVAVNQFVPVATIGTVLYDHDDSFQIKKSKIRGVVSEGMICAEDELGLGVSHDGIMVLNENALIGMQAKDYFQIEEDIVYEIGLTPNRSDAMSHYGVARDLAAAIVSREMEVISAKLPDVKAFEAPNIPSDIAIEIKDIEACPRYSGLHISNITVTDSPKWLQNMLLSIGVRPINNVVDVTNFILFELGQPLHAFDVSKICGKKIIIRKAIQNTKFTTLDGVERNLNGSELMICDEDKEMCIAGVYGGADSGVSSNTTEVFLESAYFNPVSIRKTSKLHGLKTDSSFRFERGCNPDITIYALKRAALLLQEIAGGSILTNVVDVYPSVINPFHVDISFKQIDALIGTPLNPIKVKQIIELLGINVINENLEGLSLEVPSFKADVTRPVDVIEEILRVYGYNNIQNPQLIKYRYAHQPKQPLLDLKNRISDFLADNGFLEAMNNSLTKLSYFELLPFLNTNEMVKLLNPLSRELGAMRQSLLPGLLENVAYNINHKNPDIQLFEFGNVYRLKSDSGTDVVKKYPEEMMLDLVFSGLVLPENWNETSKNVDFYFVKKCLFSMLAKAGVHVKDVLFIPISNSFIDGMEIIFQNKSIGFFGEIKLDILASFSIKQPVFYASITWKNFVNAAIFDKLKYSEINHFPEVRRDLALLVNKAITFEQLKLIAFKTEKKLLKQVGLFDIYEGDKISEDKKSYAISIFLQHSEKTLSEQEISKAMNRLIQAFAEIGATIR